LLGIKAIRGEKKGGGSAERETTKKEKRGKKGENRSSNLSLYPLPFGEGKGGEYAVFLCFSERGTGEECAHIAKHELFEGGKGGWIVGRGGDGTVWPF